VLTSTVPAARGPASEIGVGELSAVLRASAQALRPIAQIRVPLADGKLLAVLHRDSEVLHEKQADGVVEVTARVEASLLGRLRRQGIDVEIAP
jgi:50S ribosomal subunit-associated GTPase HflX